MRDLSINIINYLFGNKPLLAVFCLYVYIIELLQHHYDPKALEQHANLHHFPANVLQSYVLKCEVKYFYGLLLRFLCFYLSAILELAAW